jgi:hypothetical protein
MADRPSFGVLLTRLLKHWGTSIAWLSTSSGVAESEVRSLIDGAVPDESQLHALAPALGLHAADLFVIADVPLPEALTPLDRAAGDVISNLVHIMMALPSDQRLRIHRLVGQLPQQSRPRNEPTRALRTYDQREAGFGAMLVSMLCGNRNLHAPGNAAKTVAMLTRGRMYLSAATYPMIGYGRARLHSDWVVGFATTLSIPAGDLAALTGIESPDEPLRDDPLASEMAELIWDFRRLSAAQAKHVLDEARAMLVVVPDDGSDREWNRIFHQHDNWWGAPRTAGE